MHPAWFYSMKIPKALDLHPKTGWRSSAPATNREPSSKAESESEPISKPLHLGSTNFKIQYLKSEREAVAAGCSSGPQADSILVIWEERGAQKEIDRPGVDMIYSFKIRRGLNKEHTKTIAFNCTFRLVVFSVKSS